MCDPTKGRINPNRVDPYRHRVYGIRDSNIAYERFD